MRSIHRRTDIHSCRQMTEITNVVLYVEHGN